MKARSGSRTLTLATPVAALLFTLLLVPPATAVVAFDAVPTEGVAPLTVQFIDRSDFGYSDWNWSFGDGGTSTAQNPTHTYENDGTSTRTFTARLTARISGDPDGPGGWVYDTADVKVLVHPPVPITEQIPSIPTTTIIPPTVIPSITTPTPSTPDVDFSVSPQSGTAPLEVEFEGRSYAPNGSLLVPIRWIWDFGDPTPTAEGQSVNHRFTTPGRYRTQLTVVFRGPASIVADARDTTLNVTAEHTITVEAARITLDPVGDTVRGDTLELTGSTNLAPGTDLLVTILPASFEPTDKTQAGSFGGVTGTTRVAGGDTDNTFRFTADTAGFGPGSYRASVEAVEADAKATTTFEVVETITWTPTPTPTPITPTPTPRTAPPLSPPTAAFTWEADDADPLTVQFTDASSGDVATYVWDFGDGITSSGKNAIHVYSQDGDYTVTLTATGPGGVSTAVRELAIRRTVTSSVTPTVTPTTVPPTVTVATVTPTATGGGGGGEVPWWLAAAAGVGLLAGGAALAKWWPSPPEVVEKPVPGLTITPRGGLKRSDGTGEAPIEIEVRGGVRRER